MSAATGSRRDACPLEQLPHLREKVCSLWGTAAFDAFVRGLILDSRDGGRQGLPPEVASDLVFLSQVNKRRRGIDIEQRLGITPEAAMAKVEFQDNDPLGHDRWSDPESSRVTLKRPSDRPSAGQAGATRTPGHERETAFSLAVRFVTSRWFLLMLAALLGGKAMWPLLRPFGH